MSPTDILLALHSLDHTKDGVKLKQIMAALDHCLSLRAKFDKSVLATVLQNLIQRPTLPPLYMRFMMQGQAAIPTLKSLIVHQLSTLVNEQIWTNKSLFLGWNLAVRQNVPESFPAFLQVGNGQLHSVPNRAKGRHLTFPGQPLEGSFSSKRVYHTVGNSLANCVQCHSGWTHISQFSSVNINRRSCSSA